MEHLLGVTGPEVVAVLIATGGMFAAILLVVRMLGPRVVARLTTADLAVLLIVGAIAGRAVLGMVPTLAAGLIALAGLLVLRAAAGLVRRGRLGQRLVTARPLLLVAAGDAVDEHLRRARLGRQELQVALRLAGVASIGEVACAVLEPTGAISVTRHDPARPLDRVLFADVRGVERIPDAYFGR